MRNILLVTVAALLLAPVTTTTAAPVMTLQADQDLDTLVVGDTVMFSVFLRDLGSGLISLDVPIRYEFNAAPPRVLGVASLPAAGPIVPAGGTFNASGAADGVDVNFSGDAENLLLEDGLFFSYNVPVENPGTGSMRFDFPVLARDANGEEVDMVLANFAGEYTAVIPLPPAAWPALAMLGAMGLTVVRRRIKRRL